MSLAFDYAWDNLVKADPNQQIWARRPLYSETAYGQSDAAQDRRQRMGTVHPAIESLLARDTENAATDVKGGGYLEGIHENPTPLTSDEIDRIRMYDQLNRDSHTPSYTTHSNDPRVQGILSTNPKAPLQMPSHNVHVAKPYEQDMNEPGKTKRIEWTESGGDIPEEQHTHGVWGHPYGREGYASADAPAIQPPKGSNQDMIDRFGLFDEDADAHETPSDFRGIGGDYDTAGRNPMYAPYRGSKFMSDVWSDPDQPWSHNERSNDSNWETLRSLREMPGPSGRRMGYDNPMDRLSDWETRQRDEGKVQRLAREADAAAIREAARRKGLGNLFG